MAGAVELATAYISLVPSLKGASQKISDDLNPAAKSSGASAGQHLGTSIIGAAAKWAAPLAAAVGFGAVIKSGFDEAKDAAAGTAQLAAGIASTGNAAHLSVDGLNSLASEIQNYSGQTDDSIVKSEQLLQTFTNIKNTGPDKIFDLATKASADMAAKFGGDASSQAVVLGKALNDPVKGISALTRVGVTFTDEQKKTIESMVKTGDVAGAQKVILKELNTEFGGAAKAAGASFPGQLQRVHRAFEDLSQGIVQGFLPVMGPALEGAIKIMQKVGPVAAEAAQKVATKMASIGATIGGVFTGMKSLIMDGDITPTLLKSLGVEEDSPIIGGLLFLQDKFWAVFRGIQDFVTGFKMPSILGPENMGFNKFADAGVKVHGFLLDVKGGFQDLWAGLTMPPGFASSFGAPLGGMVAIGATIRDVFDKVVAAVGPLVAQVIPLASAFSPLQIIFHAIQPLLPQLLAMFGQLASVLGGSLLSILTALTPMFVELSGVVSDALGGVIAAVLPTVVTMITMLGTTLSRLVPIVVPIITTIVRLATTLISQLMPIITHLVASILPPLVDIFGNVLSAIGPLIEMIAGLLIPIIQALMPVVVTVFGVIASVITAAMQIVQGIIQVVTGIITGNWSQVWTGIQNIFSGIWNTIVAVVGGAIAIVWSVISAGIGLVAGFIGSILGNIGRFFSDTWSNVIGGVSGFIGNLVGFFSGLPGRILGTLGNLGGLLIGAGQALIQGFIDGIKGMVGAIGDAVGGVMDFAKQFFPHSPAKRGPFSGSGYTSFSGKALAKDFAAGIASQNGVVADAAAGIMTSASLTGKVGISSSLSNSGSARRPIYVQNPFTGEYLLAQVGGVADSRVSAADRQSTYVRPGRR